MQNLITPFLYGVVATNIILTFIIFGRGFKNPINVLFGMIALSTALWGFSITAFYAELYDLNWIVLSHSSALLLSLVFVYFSQFFPKKIADFSLLKTYIPLILFFAVSYKLFVSNTVVGNPSGISYEIGPHYPFYALLIMLNFGLGYFYLYKQYRSSTDSAEKKQVEYVFFGSLVSSLLATITDLIFPYLGVFNLTWLGPLFTLALVASIFLAILKYHLFNLRVITTQLFTFSLWIFILVRTAASRDVEEFTVNSLLLVLTVIVGIFLIKSVLKEVAQREKIEKLAQDLDDANNRLIEMDRQKSEFVSIASHQLRSPLTAIKGYSSMLLEGSFGKTSQKVTKAINTIFESSQSLVVVIDNFLNLSRIEQGRMTYEMKETELNSFVRGIVDQLLPNIEKKGLSISAEIPEQKIMATIDPDKMRQVILNLLDNSAKYTPAGWIKVKLEQKNGKRIITISDSGIGMSPETLAKIFKKFNRGVDAGKVNAGGTGLGLFLANEIMKAHNGSVRAESDGLGKGSRFIVEF